MGKRGPKAEPFRLKAAELEVVETELARRKAEKSVADRCRIALLSHEGIGPTEIAERVGLHVASVDRLLKRLRKERLAVLHDKPRPGRPRSISPSAASGDRRTGV